MSEESNIKWDLDWWGRNNIVSDIKKLSIIKCLDGSLRPPIETILPTRKRIKPDLVSLPCLHFVDKSVISKSTIPFLKEAGVEDFSENSFAIKILQSHQKDEPISWSDNHKLACIEFFEKFLKRKSSAISEEVSSRLSWLFLPTEQGKWSHAGVCYKADTILRQLIPNGEFVDLSKLGFLVKSDKFLKRIGVTDFPRVISHGSGSYWQVPNGIPEKKWQRYCQWLGEGYGNIEESFEVLGFDQFTDNLENSKAFVKYFLDHWEEYYKSYLKTTLSWFHYRQRSKEVPSYFAFQLKTREWFPTTQGLKGPSEVFLPTMENKRLALDIVPFIQLTSEELRGSHAFCDYIGVTTKLGIRSLHEIIEKASVLSVTRSLKKQFEMIYERLYIELSRTPDSTPPEYTWHLPDRNWHFDTIPNLYWIDDPELEEKLGDSVLAAWIPTNLARPQLEQLFDFFKLTRVSQVLKRQAKKDLKGEEDTILTQKIKRSADYVFSILSHYRADGVESFQDFMTKLRVLTTKDLVITLTAPYIEREAVCPCFCEIESGTIYVCQTVRTEHIAREFARAFGAPLDSAFSIEIALSELRLEDIKQKLLMSSIQVLHLSNSLQEVDSRAESLSLMAPPFEVKQAPIFEPKEAQPQPSNVVVETPQPNTFSFKAEIDEEQNGDKQTEAPSKPSEPVLSETKNRISFNNVKEEKVGSKQPTLLINDKIFEPQTSINVETKYVGPRSTTGIDHKPFEIEESATKRVVDYETQVEGRKVQSVSNWANLGYDIISQGTDGSIRYIEIKGSSEDFDELGLTESQFQAAKLLRDKYFIYRVTFTHSNPVIYSIQDPYPELEKFAELIKSYRIHGWATVFAGKIKSIDVGKRENATT